MGTGIDCAHPDLAANCWLNPVEVVDGIDNDGNGYIDDVTGWDWLHNDNSTYDHIVDSKGGDQNLGETAVMGTIAAVGGNGLGVAGVVWHTKVIALKATTEHGLVLAANAIAALDYLID